MKMKFKLNASDLIAALDVVKIVTPRAVTAQGGAGYLFMVQGTKCHVYSRDDQCVARASFDLVEVDEDGSFVYPAEYIDALRYLDGQTLTFEAEAKEDERFIVRYESSNGARTERTSFNPKLLSTCDDDLNATTTTHNYPTAILKEAIDMSRPFLAKTTDTRIEEQYKALQVFDASKPEYVKGDGHLFAADSVRAYYFWCEAFAGKGLEIHSQHLPALISFLSKSADKEVTFRMGAHFTFVENAKGHVLGWPKHAKVHAQFKYYPLKSDKNIFLIDKVQLLNSLKYTRSELEKSRDKIKIQFNHELRRVQFGVSEGTSKTDSLPVTVRPKQIDGKDWMEARDWAFSINIDHMIDLIERVKSVDVELHVLILAPEGGRKEVGMFRTLDDFRLDAAGKSVFEPEDTYKCRVTRFMPSKE
jgi:hypothetical protein